MNPHLLIPTDLARLHRFSFNLESVTRLEGVRNYTRFIKVAGQPIMTCRPLGTYLDRLPEQFIRVHKSHVVNCQYILSVDSDNHCILMTDGTSIPIARRKRTSILKLLTNPF
ncbi:LytR/AlgR family response regulator transcription factor [Runella sp.]|uniref:LytR/AlgR family response regulator transcription factor n=1 Tax=Runella sp. TaxID=1960881 RepID=UPI003D0AEA58